MREDIKEYAVNILSPIHDTYFISDISIEYRDIQQEALSNPLSSSDFKVMLNKDSSYNHFAIIHEIGHRVDVLINRILEGSYQYGSEKSPSFSHFRDAVSSTKAYRILSNEGNEYEKEWKEIFARAYSQYVVCENRKRELIKPLTIEMYRKIGLYWDLVEFTIVKDALRELLIRSNLSL